MRTTRRRCKPRVRSGSKVDDRDEIELNILGWLEHPDAELERIMELEMTPTITPEPFARSPIEEAYLRTAPNPDNFPTLVAKLKRLDMEPFAWPPEDIRGTEAPTLLIIEDSDAIRLEHAIDMFRLLGGVMGDLAGLPKSQLAVLPGTAHFVPPGSGLMDRTDWLVSMIGPFLDAPIPATERAAGGEA